MHDLVERLGRVLHFSGLPEGDRHDGLVACTRTAIGIADVEVLARLAQVGPRWRAELAVGSLAAPEEVR